NLNLEPQLFPNPATNDITIEMGGVIEQATTLRLRNQLGQVIEQRRLDVPAEQMRWEVSSLNPGLYIIEIQTEGLPPKVLRFMKR
ncbi:MAG: T9SS type A sorting domain-containing protein, partial [Phaeodactylibacter sp.]|nr:T9SS type A sorting domain-containing protein [Phaeodactylibacter sp.]